MTKKSHMEYATTACMGMSGVNDKRSHIAICDLLSCAKIDF